MSKKVFTTTFNRSVESIRDVNVIEFKSPSKVKKSLSYATDINHIYDQYCKTGRLPLNGVQPIYDENFVKYDSLIEAQKLVNDASLYFQGLPAKIKNQYGNSLEKFVKALNDKDEFLVNEGVLNLPKPDKVVEEIKPSVQPSVKPSVDVTPVTPQNPVTENVNTAPTD